MSLLSTMGKPRRGDPGTSTGSRLRVKSSKGEKAERGPAGEGG
jgi:hypothetical protein